MSIILLSNFNKKYVVDNIQIEFVNRWFYNPFITADKIHFITGSISIWVLMAIFFKGEKKVTLTDGDMFGEKFIFLRRLISFFFPLVYNSIIVFSHYQSKRLNVRNVIVERPLLPKIKVDSNISRSKSPTLLYMGHLSYFKGVDTILESFKILVKQIPEIILIIANNSIAGDYTLIEEVNNLKKKYPQNILTKGVVNPIEELSKAWVYLYPFKKPLGTMAFALSLYEAESCGVPYIACDVGANKEFFNKDYLIEKNDSSAMTKKIIQFINERKN